MTIPQFLYLRASVELQQDIGGRATRVAGFSKNKYDIYQSDMKSERDILMMMQDQKEQGRAEGRAEGIDLGYAKTKRKIAAKMKSMGLSPEQIAQATDLSIEVINSL